MKKISRILSLLLALIISFSCIPQISFAAETENDETENSSAVTEDDYPELTSADVNFFYTPGDSDSDSEVSVNDARFALRLAIGLENCESGSAQYLASDVDFDGTVKVADAREILRAAIKLDDAVRWKTCDTDEDKLPDYVEVYYHSDINAADTDLDGISDFDEMTKVNTHPDMKDSDNNGISDFDEDKDADNLSNGEEISKGTDPVLSDTDNDGLKDGAELSEYNTNPLLKDTDSDGANDGWEIENNFDPLVKNDTFEMVKSAGEVTEDNPVSASVEVTLDGAAASTLEVSKVYVCDLNLVLIPQKSLLIIFINHK